MAENAKNKKTGSREKKAFERLSAINVAYVLNQRNNSMPDMTNNNLESYLNVQDMKFEGYVSDIDISYGKKGRILIDSFLIRRHHKVILTLNHVWLDLAGCHALLPLKQEIAIGDVLKGTCNFGSKKLENGKRLYFIKDYNIWGAGLYRIKFGQDRNRIKFLESDYDRGQNWIVKIIRYHMPNDGITRIKIETKDSKLPHFNFNHYSFASAKSKMQKQKLMILADIAGIENIVKDGQIAPCLKLVNVMNMDTGKILVSKYDLPALSILRYGNALHEGSKIKFTAKELVDPITNNFVDLSGCGNFKILDNIGLPIVLPVKDSLLAGYVDYINCKNTKFSKEFELWRIKKHIAKCDFDWKISNNIRSISALAYGLSLPASKFKRVLDFMGVKPCQISANQAIYEIKDLYGKHGQAMEYIESQRDNFDPEKIEEHLATAGLKHEVNKNIISIEKPTKDIGLVARIAGKPFDQVAKFVLDASKENGILVNHCSNDKKGELTLDGEGIQIVLDHFKNTQLKDQNDQMQDSKYCKIDKMIKIITEKANFDPLNDMPLDKNTFFGFIRKNLTGTDDWKLVANKNGTGEIYIKNSPTVISEIISKISKNRAAVFIPKMYTTGEIVELIRKRFKGLLGNADKTIIAKAYFSKLARGMHIKPCKSYTPTYYNYKTKLYTYSQVNIFAAKAFILSMCFRSFILSDIVSLLLYVTSRKDIDKAELTHKIRIFCNKNNISIINDELASYSKMIKVINAFIPKMKPQKFDCTKELHVSDQVFRRVEKDKKDYVSLTQATNWINETLGRNRSTAWMRSLIKKYQKELDNYIVQESRSVSIDRTCYTTLLKLVEKENQLEKDILDGNAKEKQTTPLVSNKTVIELENKSEKENKMKDSNTKNPIITLNTLKGDYTTTQFKNHDEAINFIFKANQDGFGKPIKVVNKDGKAFAISSKMVMFI